MWLVMNGSVDVALNFFVSSMIWMERHVLVRSSAHWYTCVVDSACIWHRGQVSSSLCFHFLFLVIVGQALWKIFMNCVLVAMDELLSTESTAFQLIVDI